MHLVLSLYDKAEKLVMGNPLEPLWWSQKPKYFLNRPSISSPTHLVPSLYDKAGKLIMGNLLGPLWWCHTPQIIFLNRPSISSPTHLVPSLYDKVEKFGPVSLQRSTNHNQENMSRFFVIIILQKVQIQMFIETSYCFIGYETQSRTLHRTCFKCVWSQKLGLVMNHNESVCATPVRKVS